MSNKQTYIMFKEVLVHQINNINRSKRNDETNKTYAIIKVMDKIRQLDKDIENENQ